MKPKDRQSRIADLIGQRGEISVEALAAHFAVSAETIRRDLSVLSEAGAVQKVHGGARRQRLHSEPSFQERMTEHAAAKAVIGQKLAQRIAPGTTCFIDTGSTTLIAAEAMQAIADLTVITNSVPVAQVFARGTASVFLLGGGYAPGNAQTVGPLVMEQIARFQADHAIITVAALDRRAGATDADFDEAQIARSMIAHARQTIVLANLAKIGRAAAYSICRLEEVDMLVCEGRPEAGLVAALTDAGGVLA